MKRIYFCLLMVLLIVFVSPLCLCSPVNIEDLVREHIIRLGNWEKEEIGIQIVRIYPPNLIAEKVEFLPAGKLPPRGGAVTLPLQYLHNGVWERGSVSLYFNIYKKVLIARENISKGEFVQGRVSLDKKEAYRIPADAISSLEDVNGKVARLFVSKGTIIVPRLLEEPLLVKRGEIVTVYVKIKNVELSTLGEALMNGHLGDIIKVKNIDSSRIMMVRVVDKGKTEIVTLRKEEG